MGFGGAFVTRLSADGDITYTQQFGGNVSALARAVELGADGDLYIAGEVSTELVTGAHAGKVDGFARRLMLDGTPVWTEQWGTADTETVYGLALGSSGTVYVVGGTRGAFPGFSVGSDYDAYLAVIETLIAPGGRHVEDSDVAGGAFLARFPVWRLRGHGAGPDHGSGGALRSR